MVQPCLQEISSKIEEFLASDSNSGVDLFFKCLSLKSKILHADKAVSNKILDRADFWEIEEAISEIKKKMTEKMLGQGNFEKAIRIAGDSMSCLELIGEKYIEKKQYSEALAFIEKKIGPKNYKIGYHDVALKLCLKLLREGGLGFKTQVKVILSGMTKDILVLCTIDLECGDIQAAYDTALELEKQRKAEGDFCINLRFDEMADFLASKGDVKGIEQLYAITEIYGRKSFFNKISDRSYYVKALAYNGQFDKAKAEAKRLQDSCKKKAFNFIAGAYLVRGDLSKAKLTVHPLKVFEKKEIYSKLVDAFLAQNNLQQAEMIADEIKTCKSREDPYLYITLAEVNKKIENYKKQRS